MSKLIMSSRKKITGELFIDVDKWRRKEIDRGVCGRERDRDAHPRTRAYTHKHTHKLGGGEIEIGRVREIIENAPL